MNYLLCDDLGPYTTFFTLDGQDEGQDNICVTYKMWGPMYLWDVLTWSPVTARWQRVCTGSIGPLVVEYLDMMGQPLP